MSNEKYVSLPLKTKQMLKYFAYFRVVSVINPINMVRVNENNSILQIVSLLFQNAILQRYKL